MSEVDVVVWCVASSPSDRAVASAIHERLLAGDINCVLFEARALRPDSLRTAKVVVLVVSAASAHPYAMLKSVAGAIARGSVVVPVRIGGTESDPALLSLFRSRDWIVVSAPLDYSTLDAIFIQVRLILGPVWIDPAPEPVRPANSEPPFTEPARREESTGGEAYGDDLAPPPSSARPRSSWWERLQGIVAGVIDLLNPGVEVDVKSGEPCPTMAQTSAPEVVQFSGTVPATMRPGKPYVVQAWMHTGEQRAEMLRSAMEAQRKEIVAVSEGDQPMERGTVVEVSLQSDEIDVRVPTKTLVWRGDVVGATFPVRVPEGADGEAMLAASFRVSGLEIATLYFTVAVADYDSTEEAPVRVRRVRRAFASHASQDKPKVLDCILGMHAVAPEVEVFYDRDALRAGQEFEARLAEEVDRADVLFLFWSAAAKGSPWVEWEWRRAYAARGKEAICPVPLEPPERVAPPDELRSLHFGDPVLAQQAYERAIREEGAF